MDSSYSPINDEIMNNIQEALDRIGVKVTGIEMFYNSKKLIIEAKCDTIQQPPRQGYMNKKSF